MGNLRASGAIRSDRRGQIEMEPILSLPDIYQRGPNFIDSRNCSVTVQGLLGPFAPEIKSVFHRTSLYFLVAVLRGPGAGFGFPAFSAFSIAMCANITGPRPSAPPIRSAP